MTSEHDDDLPMDPAESLRLIERERAEAERKLTPDPRVFLWPWGFAWLISFTLLFLRFGPGGRVFVDMPDWVPLAVLAATMITAGAFTGVVGARSGRWISGPSSRQGAFYGITWSVAFFGLSTVLGRVSQFVPDGEVNLLWAGAMVALTGALHMAGGAIYNDKNVFLLGVFISAINVIGVFAGPGWHALLLAVLGGGGMLAAGAYAKSRLPKAQKAEAQNAEAETAEARNAGAGNAEAGNQ